MSNLFGYGSALLGGSSLLALSLLSLLPASTAAIITGLLLLCAGFFTVHAAAVGALNGKLVEGQGRANALYVLFYYAGGWLGITGCGFAYERGGWNAVVFACMFFLLLPLGAGIVEKCGERCGLE
jgi:YNFM family putative membrane transporter